MSGLILARRRQAWPGSGGKLRRKRQLDKLLARREVEAAQRRQRQGRSRGADRFLLVRHSKIPGKARGDRCWYSYAGKEHYTKDFEIMRGQSLSRTVDGAEPQGKQLDKHGELWCAVANSYFGTDAAGSRMVAKSM